MILIGKTEGHFSLVSPASLPGASASYCQRALVDESGMIKSETGRTIDQ
jgi:hypothetical protein